MTVFDIPKDLQIVISNYEPKFAVFLTHPDWQFLIKQNFGLEFSTDILTRELRMLYVDMCFRDKSMFPSTYYTLIM